MARGTIGHYSPLAAMALAMSVGRVSGTDIAVVADRDDAIEPASTKKHSNAREIARRQRQAARATAKKMDPSNR
jgi:hypothetical protein